MEQLQSDLFLVHVHRVLHVLLLPSPSAAPRSTSSMVWHLDAICVHGPVVVVVAEVVVHVERLEKITDNSVPDEVA